MTRTRTINPSHPETINVSTVRRFLTPVYPRAGRSVELGRQLTLGRNGGPGTLRLDDPTVSGAHCQLASARKLTSWSIKDLGSRNGTFVDGVQVVGEQILNNEAVICIGEHALVYSVITEAPSHIHVPQLMSPRLAIAEARVRQYSSVQTPPSLLLLGPSGSGKERLAHIAHTESERQGAFVPVNCATLTPERVGSDLWGHLRGAFTGAVADHAGFFREAHQGTLFLDEIGDLPPSIQPALLRAVEEGTFRPLGASKDERADVRVVAATHLDIETLADEGHFRTDLLARLAGVRVALHGLDRRRADILPLLAHFLDRDPHRPGAWLTFDAARWLLHRSWLLNIREVRDFARTLEISALGQEQLDVPHLLEVAQLRPRRQKRWPDWVDPDTPEGMRWLLDHYEGNVSLLARDWARSRQSVYRLIERLGLSAYVPQGGNKSE
ncbi:MAG: sigma-54-dependent Fis family transcriptional regulator [Bradymonadia bacterium]